jgi:TRAP-type mannitol/chloroaromatic compound transport system permease small subunit
MAFLDRAIDALNEKVGVTTAYLVFPLIGVVAYEVVMRYAFNAPTSWGFEMTTFIYGVHFILTLGFAHKHDGHVAIDIFESRLPHKPRTILRIIANLCLFIPTIGLLAIWSVLYAKTSWLDWEHASSSWAPAIYPYKTLMAIGFILFFLQGVARLIQDFRALRNTD